MTVENKKYLYRFDEYIDYIIYLFMYIYLIIDLIAGYLTITTDSSGKTQLFKIFFYMLIILSIALKNSNYFCFILFCFTWMFFSAINIIINHNSNVIDTMSYFVRFIIIPLSFFYYRLLMQDNKEYKDMLFQKIFFINIIVFITNFILGLLGYGFSSYSSGFGIKGFFHHATEVAVLMYCFFYYILLKIHKKILLRIFIYIIVLIMAVLIGTKASILSIFLFSIVDWYYNISGRLKNVIKILFPLIVFVLTCFIINIGLQTEFYNHLEKTIIRNVGNDNIINILLSGRITQVTTYLTYYYENFSLSNLFFGLGYLVYRDGHGPMEIDFFFVFFFYGIVILFILLSFYLYIIYLCIKYKNIRLFYFNLIYFFISFSSGYVWQNVMAGIFYTYINAYELLKQKTVRKKTYNSNFVINCI